MKTWIILLHRWLGVALCANFALWFASGMVMAFVDDMPYAQDRPDWWARQPSLDMQAYRLSPGQAAAALGLTRSPESLEAGQLLGRPLWRFKLDGSYRQVDAIHGKVLARLDPGMALQVAQTWVSGPVLAQEQIEDDQWTVYAGRFKAHRPLYRVKFGDPKATWVYVSSTTGQVVQSVDRRSRFLGWIGPVIHWIYFTPIRRDRLLWTWVVDILAGLGILACLSGLVLGVWQYRWMALDGPKVPYKDAWLRWHHILGLFFGVLTFTWVFSGLLSMSPFGWPWPDDTGEAPELIAQGPLQPEEWGVPFVSPSKSLKALEALRFDGKPYWALTLDDGSRRLLPAGKEGGELLERISPEAMEKAARRVWGAKIREVSLLTAYDEYYYSKRGKKSLPALKVVLNGPGKPTYYLDLQRATVDSYYTPLTRLNRWFYSGLHRLDFGFLLRDLNVWYAVVLVLLCGGLALCITGIFLSFKVLKR
jgi:uncharacterized membrane protein YkoI